MASGHVRAAVFTACLSFLLATAAVAQESSPVTRVSDGVGGHADAPHVTAAPLDGDIRIDGRLDEAAWARATPAPLPTQRDPDEGAAPTEQTELRVLVGHSALYIGARMYDREPSRIVRRLDRRDQQPASDRLTIRLDARHDHLTAFVFDIFPAGNKADASQGADGYEDDSWDPVWDVATSIDSLGWTAEVRIPLSQLRYDRSADTWGIQVVRFIQRRQEEDVLSYVPKTENSGPNRYGHLEGMRDLPAPRRLEVVPYVASHAEFQDVASGNPFRDGSDVFGSVGADLRAGITSDLTLDATVNPDFGQVEVDPAVVNLSAFETFFPEKRSFFVEGADLFRFGQLSTFNSFGTPDVFFSRRIGRHPQGDITDPSATFTDVPEQTTILGAAKLTGKTRSGWSIAVLDAVTPEERGRYAVPGGPIQRQTVEPLTNYFAARVRREFRQGNTAVGGMVTAVNRSLDDSVLAGSLRSSAYVAGVDLNHAWDDRAWQLDASFAGSLVRGSAEAIDRAQRSSARYYQRPDADLGYDPTRTSLGGYAAQVAVTKISGGRWGGNLAYQEKSPGYETNDLGFTQTVGRRGVSTDLHVEQTRPGPLFRNWIVGVLSGNDWNYDGDHTTKYVGNIINVRFLNFWRLNTNIFNYFSSYDDQLTRGGPLAKLPRRTYMDFFLNSDDRGMLTVGASASINWNGGGGYARIFGLNASLRPAPNIRLRFEPNYSRFHNVSQFVTGVADTFATATFGRRAVFATVEQRELALDTRLDWTFSPTMSVQLFVQPLISAGDFHDYKEFVKPGTFDFATYGRDQGTIQRASDGTFTVDPDGAGPAGTFSFADRNFNFRSLLANLVFRWEYRPGSTIFVVWQQSRQGVAPTGDFSFRRDFDAIFSSPARNLIAVKATWWMGF